MSTRKVLPGAPSFLRAGRPVGNVQKVNDAAALIHKRVAPNRRTLNILSTLATGHLPWGEPWPDGLTRDGNRWVLCCGHAMNFEEAARFTGAGLLQEVRRDDGREALAVTEAGREWLAGNWPT